MKSRLLLGALAVVLAAGCNSGSAARQTVNLAERIRLAAETGNEAGTSKMHMRMEMPQGGMTAEGAFDYKGQRGQMTMAFTGELAAAGNMEMIMDGRVIYMKIPALAAQSGGKPWFKLDLDELLKSGGMAGLDQLQNSDPSSSLAFLKGVAEDVREEGKEQVRGVDTTRYAITVDLNKAAATAPAEAKKSIEGVVKQLGTNTIPMTVWVDDEDRVRRLAYSMDMSKMEAGATGTAKLTMELYDYGTKVSVTPPPAAQVTDASGMLGGGGAGS